MMMRRGVLAAVLAALTSTAVADNTCVAMSIADYGVVTIELADDQVCRGPPHHIFCARISHADLNRLPIALVHDCCRVCDGLHPAQTPITVANFLDYVDSDFYDGLIFHRVIENFMIQGGGYTSDLTEKSWDAGL